MAGAYESENFFLRWENFENNLIEGFQAMLNGEELLDVTLVAEDSQLQAHKVVLSAYSGYFRNIFRVNPCRHPVIILKDVCARDLSSIVQFMYHGQVVIKRHHLRPFLQTARTLNIKGLIENENRGASSGYGDPNRLPAIPAEITVISDSEDEVSEMNYSHSAPTEPAPEPTPEPASEPAPEPVPEVPQLQNPANNDQFTYKQENIDEDVYVDVDIDDDIDVDVDVDTLQPMPFIPIQGMTVEEKQIELQGENDSRGDISPPEINSPQGTFGAQDLCEGILEELSPPNNISVPEMSTASSSGTPPVISAVGLTQAKRGAGVQILRKASRRAARGSSEEPMLCPVCKRPFLLRSSLRMHITMTHKGIVSEVMQPPTKVSRPAAGSCLLAQESVPALKESSMQKKTQRPVLQPTESNFSTSGNELERGKRISERKEPVVTAQKEREATDESMVQFLKRASLAVQRGREIVNGGKRDCSPVACSSPTKKRAVYVGGQSAEPGPSNSAASAGSGDTNSKTAEMDELKQVILLLSNRLSDVEEHINKATVPKQSAVTAVTTSSNVETKNLDIDGDKVLLGDGIKCSMSSYQTMLHTTNKQDWCGALLYGVFGENAKFYRFNIQKKSEGKLFRFPPEFNSVAKVLYSQFLQRVNPSEKIKERDLKFVLRLLSRKARDMNGRRNRPRTDDPFEMIVDDHLVLLDAINYDDDGEENGASLSSSATDRTIVYSSLLQ